VSEEAYLDYQITANVLLSLLIEDLAQPRGIPYQQRHTPCSLGQEPLEHFQAFVFATNFYAHNGC